MKIVWRLRLVVDFLGLTSPPPLLQGNTLFVVCGIVAGEGSLPPPLKFSLSENFLLFQKYKISDCTSPILGNLGGGAELKLWAPVSHLWEICSCLSEIVTCVVCCLLSILRWCCSVLCNMRSPNWCLVVRIAFFSLWYVIYRFKMCKNSRLLPIFNTSFCTYSVTRTFT